MKTVLLILIFGFLQVNSANIPPRREVVLKNLSPDQLREHAGRIMDGTLATQGQLKYQAALYSYVLSSDGYVFCGGSLISSTVVMTAGHCLVDALNVTVVLGTLEPLNTASPGYYTQLTVNYVIHPQFNYSYGLNNDIGLVKLSSPVPLDSNKNIILLPKRSDSTINLIGQTGRVSGWGTTSDASSEANRYLLYADVPIIDNLNCEQAYGANYVPPTKMCVSTLDGTKGACNGDSGGPLSYTKSGGEVIQVGIVSFGASAGCQSGYPEVFTRVTSFIDWIAANGGPAVRP